jgi:hypothetical protein
MAMLLLIALAVGIVVAIEMDSRCMADRDTALLLSHSGPFSPGAPRRTRATVDLQDLRERWDHLYKNRPISNSPR